MKSEFLWCCGWKEGYELQEVAELRNSNEVMVKETSR